MKQKLTRIAGLASALAVSATALVLTTGVAEAATCSAGADQACVKVISRSIDVGSVRVNGACLQDTVNRTNYYSGTTVSRTGTPTLLTYSGRKCEDNSRIRAEVSWSATTGSDGFREVTVQTLF